MTAGTRRPTPARRGRGRRPQRIFALMMFVLGIAALGTATVYDQARRRDDLREAGQRASLQGAVEALRAAFADATASRAAELALVIAGRTGDLQDALAPRGPAALAYRSAFVLAPDRATTAAYPPAQTSLPPEIGELIERHRGVRTGAVASDIFLLDDTPTLVAVAAMPTVAVSEAGAPLLAAIRPLDADAVATLARTAGLSRLNLENQAASDGRPAQPLVDRNGRLISWLSWDADRPMTRTVQQLTPTIILAILSIVGLTALSLGLLRRNAQALLESEAQLWRLANEDSLTGLPNHHNMLDLVEDALAARSGDQIVTFAYIDLDGFKEINDSLGHQVGDQLLTAVAERLQSALPDEVEGGRFGGDEFAVVMTSHRAEDGVNLAQTVIETLAQPYWINGRVIEIAASIGLAQAPGDAATRDELTRRADLALRAAKTVGRSLLVCFDPVMDSEFEEQRFFKRELQKALAEDALAVHYQPIVAADGSRIVGVEALLRWTHPVRGIIPPTVFIPIAEQTGMMDELGAFVLKRALSDAMRWPDLYIAVNLSPVQVRERGIVERIKAALTWSGIEPGRLVLEITEGVLMENPAEAKERLEELRAIGVRIALDDFGSGYSSLSYLQRFPFDKLKIDQAFVKPLGRTGSGGVIIQAIVALGRALGVTVLVEGVETEQQRVLLRLAGCDEMQGFLFAEPCAPETLDRLWSESNLHPANARHAIRAGA